MAKQFFAACNVNGPISVAIEADSIEEAVTFFEDMDHQDLIDNAYCEADDELDIDGDGMDEGEFAEAMEAAGCVVVRDLSTVDNYHSGTTRHLSGGWVLFELRYRRDEIIDAVEAADVCCPEQVCDMVIAAAERGEDWRAELGRAKERDAAERRSLGAN